jgi:hypothetical protein
MAMGSGEALNERILGGDCRREPSAMRSSTNPRRSSERCWQGKMVTHRGRIEVDEANLSLLPE